MQIKLVGALLVILGCGGFGFSLAASHRAEEKTLRRLIAALDYMTCELQYRLTPLPQLCRQAAGQTSGVVRNVFSEFACELEDQISPDVFSCMNRALEKCGEIPKSSAECFKELGTSLGRFDLNGQLNGLDGIRTMCRHRLEGFEKNKDVRIRSYQTLGLCAGAALAILLI